MIFNVAPVIALGLVLFWFWSHNAVAHLAVQCGTASWYAHTGRTASGEKADPSLLAAAHRTLPLGTQIEVENLRNGRAVVVRINDRGPFIKTRLIDVSRAAAEKLGFLSQGLAPVRIRQLHSKSDGEIVACR